MRAPRGRDERARRGGRRRGGPLTAPARRATAPAPLREAAAFLAASTPGEVLASTGVPRSGKSRTVKLADQLGAFPRRLVFEPYAARDRIESARGNQLYPWAGEVVAFPELVRNPRRYLCRAAPLRLVIDPACDPFDARELGRRFTSCAKLAFYAGGVDLIAEEAALYAREATPAMLLVATGGGHARMRLVVISQRFGRIHIDARGCITRIVAFAQSEAADLDALRTKCGPAWTAKVARLDREAGTPVTWRIGQRD